MRIIVNPPGSQSGMVKFKDNSWDDLTDDWSILPVMKIMEIVINDQTLSAVLDS